MSTPAPAALLAFLRGLERRALTLAAAQCGDPVRADWIWRDVADAFPEEATRLPVAQWPVTFWKRLLAHPTMTATEAPGSPLAALGPGPRAAVLLRLVAGLDPRPAAEVLGVTEPTYRFALQRGLEQARAAGIDADALAALRQGWQKQPAPSTPTATAFVPVPEAHNEPDLSAMAPRQIPVETESPAPAVAPLARPDAPAPLEFRSRADVLEHLEASPPRTKHRGLLIAALTLVLAGVAGTWLWLRREAPPAPAPAPVAITAEPVSAPAPVSPVTHPDYLLVASPSDAALAADLAMLSWVASPDAAAADVAPEGAAK